MVRKREITVQKHEAGETLNIWLSKRYTYHTIDVWTEHINAGRITLNGEEIPPSTIINSNDLVIYYPKPIIEPPINPNYIVLHEDDDLLVINKPNDIPCHPGGIYFKHTLWYILKKKYDYISLINRLDRETSGVMLIAKNKISAKFYFNQMMERNIKKQYLVLVHGEFPEKLSAKGWLSPDTASVIRKKRLFILDKEACQPEGEGDPNKQFSHSEFELIKYKNGISQVKCNILTGRTHQIRATLCSLGYPVVGDKIYGLDDSFFFKFINDELTEKNWNDLKLENQALHSWKTEISMLNGERSIFTAKQPEEWSIL